MTIGVGSDSYAVPERGGEGGTLSAAIERVLVKFGEVARRAGAAHGLAGDDVDEVLQEVRLRLWRAGSAAGEAVGKLETLTPSYVYRAAASAAIDLLRRRRARREQRLADARDDGATVEPSGGSFGGSVRQADEALIADETARAIGASLEELVPSRRAVVRMYLKGYDREEIAALLGWSEAKTRNLLYRGLDDLRRRLTAKGIHP